jgi:hypothetical protein
MTDLSQTDVATILVDSETTLESVRRSQHRDPGVSKALLIQDVVQSLTKNCEVMHEPELLLVDLTRQLYAEDRVDETLDPGAPTPKTAP